ncbi:hypothetical protein ICM05_03885 [Leucobacter sp. cx-42]|uniref:hypothetical protein n=1 Tax=unclassified Leucobacter TaxID=2621730 RepID=UPI00165E10F0|nr:MULTISPECIES: hypothetical protein [unclassified Leucobacter]MBC9953793.1 hypothetical protein [Leucobacter sp. cx-42]
MKAFFGFLQFVLGAVGLFALFNGQWVAVLICWAGAGFVGFIGGRLVRRVEGVSEGGRQVLQSIGQAVQKLEIGDYDAANGLMASAVFQFKAGGDKGLLVLALSLQAVTKAAVGDYDAARRVIEEARYRIAHMPRGSGVDEAEMREMLAEVHVVLSIVETAIFRGERPERIVQEFLEFNSEA